MPCFHRGFVAHSCGAALAEGSRVNITDLNSTNGTYLGSEELTPMRAQDVSPGTEVTFGMTPLLACAPKARS